MAQNPSNIHIGAARIFLGVSPPPTGNPPTLTPHNAEGEPTTGIEVGYTQDAASFTYKQNKQEVEAEQSLNPVDVFVVNEEITIEFNAMEHTYVALKTAFDNVGSINDPNKLLFYGGDGGGLVSVTTQCVVLTSRIRNAPQKFEVLTIYRVYNVEGVSIPYNRTGVAVYKVTLKGLTDTTRQAGDRLFQWYREKPILAYGATEQSAPTEGYFTPVGADKPMNLTSMGPIVPKSLDSAAPLAPWVFGNFITMGDTNKAHWNGVGWVHGTATTADQAKAGKPGTWLPTGSVPRASMQGDNMAGCEALNAAGTPSGATPWAADEYIRTGDDDQIFWDGTAWAPYSPVRAAADEEEQKTGLVGKKPAEKVERPGNGKDVKGQ